MNDDMYGVKIYELVEDVKALVMDLYCGDGDDAYDFNRLHQIGDVLREINSRANSLENDVEYYKTMYLRNNDKLKELGVMGKYKMEES